MVSTDNGSMGGTHLTCFYMNDNFSFESIAVLPDNFLTNQITKPINFIFTKLRISIVNYAERIVYTFSIA